MPGNSFGQAFRITTFGESHGAALGVVVDGCPAGVPFCEDLLGKKMARRRPGQSQWVSARQEQDAVEVLSGVFQGKTLGTPICMIVRNQDARSEEYQEIQKNPRAGHADDLWREKFGHADHRGGGRASGRETVCRVMAGAVAEMFLKEIWPGLTAVSFASQIGDHTLTPEELQQALGGELSNPQVDAFAVRFPSERNSHAVTDLLSQAKAEGKSYGGTATCVVHGLPKGLGQPVFHKLKADLAQACLSIGATAHFEMGLGQAWLSQEGSETHAFESADVNPYGGDRGGISTGAPLVVRVGFKPTSSVLDVAKKGRHDPCIVPRALVAVEAMVHLVLADHALLARSDRVSF